MKRVLLVAAALAASTTLASADVVFDLNGNGTGDNVIFDSFNGTNLAIGSFNGQHQGFVFFTDLSGNPNFTGAANGQDIKISNTSDLDIQVFANDKTTVLGTATDVFSIVGTGQLTITATANDGIFTKVEDLQNGQNFFTLNATNGESISLIEVAVTGVGSGITDFEHYRVDVAAPVPGPIVGAGIPGLLSGAFGLYLFGRRRIAKWRGVSVA